MDFDQYQMVIKKSDLQDSEKWMKNQNLGDVAFVEKALGLAGEVGEVVDKVKKVIRDKGGKATEEDREEIKKELGDVLWYTASMARYLGIPFSEVMKENVIKMESRMVRGVLHGEGDNR